MSHNKYTTKFITCTFLVCLIVESFKKVLICHLVIGSIVVYRIPIIPNILNKVVNYVELRVVKG